MPNRIWIGLLLLITCVGSSGCRPRESPVSIATLRAEEAPDQESWSPSLVISEDGRPLIHLTALYMARYEKPDSSYMVLTGEADSSQRVRVDLFDAEGDSSAVVFSDILTYYDRERRFVARGNVIVITRENKRLESEHLAWTEIDRRVRTPGFARFISPNRDVSGYGLVAVEDLSSFQMTRVTGTIIPDGEG